LTIDTRLFDVFIDGYLSFEYRKVEFMEGQGRVAQVTDWMKTLPAGQRAFVWVHLFGPHEPYEAHAAHPFGDRDVDRYDSEIAAADATVGALVKAFRTRRSDSVVIVTSDHGEEFGERGASRHERLRGRCACRWLSAPRASQRAGSPNRWAIDLMPTMLAVLGAASPACAVAIRALIVARSLEMGYICRDRTALLAEGSHRLLCDRKVGACRLYDRRATPPAA
jgi:membrane-anchored protein YejM (alkaline phosphatase superfamily)